MVSTQLLPEIEDLVAQARAECESAELKGNKSAAKRARKAFSEIAKVAKSARKSLLPSQQVVE